MTVPIPTVTAGFMGLRTFRKLGSFSLGLRPALRQPPIPPGLAVQAPRFFGRDQTGSLFGLAGYDRTVPCWNPIANSVSVPVQYPGFQARAGSFWGLWGMLANPAQYHPLFSEWDQSDLGMLCNPPSSNGLLFQTGTSGIGAFFTNAASANVDSTGNYSISLPSYSIPMPDLVFADTTFKFAPLASPKQISLGVGCLGGVGHGLGGFIQTYGNPSFLLETSSGLEYLSRFSVTNNPVLPADATFCTCSGAFDPRYAYADMAVDYVNGTAGNPYDGYNVGSGYSAPLYFARNGGVSGVSSTWVPNTSASQTYMTTAKVHAASGNFVRFYGQYSPIAGVHWVAGNVWSPAYDGVNIQRGPIYSIAFDDVTDNGLLGGSTTATKPDVQQIPGGGFLVMDSVAFPNVLFLINSDFSGYWRINVSGMPNYFPNNTEPANAEIVSFDADGFLYVLGYQTLQFGTPHTFQQALYSGPGKPTVYLPGSAALSPVSSWASICRDPDNCDTAWEA